MADRDDVTGLPVFCAALVLAVSALLLASCSSGTQSSHDTTNRGQVLDQDTGQPIAGVIVIGTYEGSVRGSGATSCNRVETTVSDENGWFELPLDPQAGPLWMEGYHKDYRHGYPVRVPICLEGRPDQCQIWEERRDDGDQVVSVVKEPKIYDGEAEAAKAARYLEDLYLKRFKGTREERLQELHRLIGANSCLAAPRTSKGPIPFMEAILYEQTVLTDSQDAIRITREQMQTAREILQSRK